VALTGLQIYKLLPKTNCKKCGFPTCLAFAMKLAQKGVELSVCEDLSEAGRAGLKVVKDEAVMAGDIFRRIDAIKPGVDEKGE